MNLSIIDDATKRLMEEDLKPMQLRELLAYVSRAIKGWESFSSPIYVACRELTLHAVAMELDRRLQIQCQIEQKTGGKK